MRANTVSASTTLEAINNSIQTLVSADATSRSGLQASIDTLNATLLETNRAVGGLRDDTTFLVVGQKEQSSQIDELGRQIELVKFAVGEAGIRVKSPKIVDFLSPTSEGWKAVRSKYGIGDDEPIFLEIAPFR